MNQFSNLGVVVSTNGIKDLSEKCPAFKSFVSQCFSRYIVKDWGDLDYVDILANEEAIKNGDDRVLGAYEFNDTKIYIVTEADRSLTTILFAGEY